MDEDVVSPAQVKEDLDRIRRDLAATLSGQIAAHTVSLEMGRDGLVISLREAGFFESGSATPKPEALPTLRQIADKLGADAVRFAHRGPHRQCAHPQLRSSIPTGSYPSARATHIARLFLEMKAIPADRLSAAGYAEFHPVASNDTAEGRAENRRVDLVVMPRTKINFAAPASGAPSGPWRKVTDGEQRS